MRAIENTAGGELAGSQAELLSAMSNLLNNAIRYTPAGGSIELRWQSLPDGRAEFSVQDSGPGIAPEHIPRLTERVVTYKETLCQINTYLPSSTLS